VPPIHAVKQPRFDFSLNPADSVHTHLDAAGEMARFFKPPQVSSGEGNSFSDLLKGQDF
jgi:hypothetical protein